MALVIVTDLDGTLLDHNTYSSDPAVHALDQAKRMGVPVVLCSSKTRAEIESIRRRLGIADPFIPENGGAVVAPNHYFEPPPPGSVVAQGRVTLEIGLSYEKVVALLKDVAAAEHLKLIGFSDMTVSEVAGDCGMPLLEAQLAKLRQYDEPFRLIGADDVARGRFLRALRRRGLRVVTGGRYDHATGEVDKGHAVRVLRTLYARRSGRVVMIGLGDGLNDLSMLQAVDRPVIVRNEHGGATSELARKVPTAFVTQASGPAGWAEAVTTLLRQWAAEEAGSPARSRREQH